MKKLFSLLLAIVLVVGALCTTASASYVNRTSTTYIQGGTDAYDLYAYGLHTFNAYKVTAAPTLDGVISTGEYVAAADVSTIGDGLALTNSLGTTDYTADYGEEYKNFKITTYLVYDSEYAYIAEVVEGDKEISVALPSGGDSTLNTSVRYGLNQSKEIPEAASRLSNTYTYNYNGGALDVYKCASGNRTYKVINGAVSKTVTLDDDPYTDASATVWNKEEYQKATAAKHTTDAGKHSYVFEYKIPLTDIAYSACGKYDAATVASLLSKGKFYGSYLFQVAVTRTGGDDHTTHLFLTTGKAGNGTIYPFSSPGEGAPSTWSKAVKEYWTNDAGESFSISYLPSPIHHNGAYDPSNPVVHATSVFRPGMSGYSLNEVASVYKVGTTATFTVIPDAIENVNPVEGDCRMIPTQFRLRQGSNSKLTGTFASDYKTAKFQTKGLSTGVYSLVVTFTMQRFDGSKWVDTEITKNLARNITIAGSVMASAESGASQTGDNISYVLMACGALLLTAGTAVAVLTRKKKVM
ncbi:MAG: LPXTG cell wall anchor domain-containing protein [Clostridia bacterium]|nr:LPXTG cell wall anchor domain-containing protein [Clostridia bacterium]